MYSSIHSFIHSFIRWFIYSFICPSSIHPFIHTSIHPYIHSFIHPFIHPSIFLFFHSFIHSPYALCLCVESENGASECYSQLNTQGRQIGNCGSRGGQYVACETEHAQCGQLMCNGGTFQRSATPGLAPRINRQTILVNSTVRELCYSFTLSPASDTVSPGLVTDGTRCGNTSVS